MFPKKKILFFAPSIEEGGVEKNLFIVTNFIARHKEYEVFLLTANKNKNKKFSKKINFICPSTNFWNNQPGIYLYSFSLDPKNLQPSGSMNFSKIDDGYIQLTMNNIINYQNPASVRAYSIQYNLFRISNGIGGLTFNN